MTEQLPVEVRRDESKRRYEATIDGALAGYVDYEQDENAITLHHTRTLTGYEGRGVGSAVAEFALADIRARGAEAVVHCPFIRAWIAKHPGEYDDLLADET